jgi:arginine N-succinyltransferase
VKYAEADRFCQHNRSFIKELLPKEEIYLTLLPLEVLNQVAQVGPETAPARKLLENLGFRYRGFIDPFDGGPHLDAPTDSVPLVSSTRRMVLGKPADAERCTKHGMIGRLDEEGEFRAVESVFDLGSDGTVRVPEPAMKLLECASGARVSLTPLASPGEHGKPVAEVAPRRKKVKA